MNNKILYEGKVIDNIDPKGLGRIRVHPEEWFIDVQKNIRDFNEKTEKWVEFQDPFVFRPLLPNYFNIVPQEGEPVILIYKDTENQHFNGFYIPMSMTDRSKPDSSSYEQKSIFSRRGFNYKKPIDLYDEFGNSKRKVYDGAFPSKDEFGFSGRGNSDLRFTDKSIILRSGQINEELTRKEGVPVRENNPAMVQLSLFEDIRIKEQVGVEEVIEFQEKSMSSLVEYDINLNDDDTFNYSILLFDISNSTNVNSKNMGLFTSPNNKSLVLSISNPSPVQNINDVITEIRYNIKKILNEANRGNHGKINEIKDNVRQNKGMSKTYPFYFRPTSVTYQRALNNESISVEDLKKLKVKTRIGWGSIFSKTEINTPSIERKIPKYGYPNIGTKKVITQLSDINLLLSYENSTPSNGVPIDFNKISNKEINGESVGRLLEDHTFSMVRGEKLYELILAMYQFLITHVHNPAEPGVTKPEITRNLNEKMVNFMTDILSTKNRIN